MATKLDKVVIQNQELPLIKLIDLSITCFLRSCVILNALYLHLHQTNGHQTWQGGDSP